MPRFNLNASLWFFVAVCVVFVGRVFQPNDDNIRRQPERNWSWLATLTVARLETDWTGNCRLRWPLLLLSLLLRWRRYLRTHIHIHTHSNSIQQLRERERSRRLLAYTRVVQLTALLSSRSLPLSLSLSLPLVDMLTRLIYFSSLCMFGIHLVC